MSSNVYKYKYLKYKQRYQNLVKTQLGGNTEIALAVIKLEVEDFPSDGLNRWLTAVSKDLQEQIITVMNKSVIQYAHAEQSFAKKAFGDLFPIKSLTLKAVDKDDQITVLITTNLPNVAGEFSLSKKRTQSAFEEIGNTDISFSDMFRKIDRALYVSPFGAIKWSLTDKTPFYQYDHSQCGRLGNLLFYMAKITDKCLCQETDFICVLLDNGIKATEYFKEIVLPVNIGLEPNIRQGIYFSFGAPWHIVPTHNKCGSKRLKNTLYQSDQDMYEWPLVEQRPLIKKFFQVLLETIPNRFQGKLPDKISTVMHFRGDDFCITRENTGNSNFFVLHFLYYVKALQKVYGGDVCIFAPPKDRHILEIMKRYLAYYFQEIEFYTEYELFEGISHPLELIFLMSNASNIILSNSTFSFWSGYLSEENTTVIGSFHDCKTGIDRILDDCTPPYHSPYYLLFYGLDKVFGRKSDDEEGDWISINAENEEMLVFFCRYELYHPQNRFKVALVSHGGLFLMIQYIWEGQVPTLDEIGNRYKEIIPNNDLIYDDNIISKRDTNIEVMHHCIDQIVSARTKNKPAYKAGDKVSVLLIILSKIIPRDELSLVNAINMCNWHIYLLEEFNGTLLNREQLPRQHSLSTISLEER